MSITRDKDIDLSPKPASRYTTEANQRVKEHLPFELPSEAEKYREARERGFLETWNPLRIMSGGDDARPVWDLQPYKEFLDGDPDAPFEVNPSLWRQAKINLANGLYEVIPGRVYQIRAFDMSNMTIIRGNEGLIVIDPLISVECAADGLRLFKEHFDCRDAVVKAVIFTHSHVDHFGGVLGVISEAQVEARSVEVIAPQGFLEHAVSENVYAGVAMTRRAQYMYGPYLHKGIRGQVDGGLGKGQSIGRVSIVRPNEIIDSDKRHRVDGVEIEFHMTPGAEAPAEFDFYFPQFKAFCTAENATHTMHNIQTLRGARVRDALLWSKYMNETLQRYGDAAEVLFASHHWPVWNTKWNEEGSKEKNEVATFLRHQRDMYRYLNDQTLRMLNLGYTGVEIAEVFKMPEALDREWSCRGYYGTVSHNVKGVYDRYMGWFDGNPSNLHALPPRESSPKYVKLMGGPTVVLSAARRAAERGEYRWAAELMNKLLFTEPDNEEAKAFQADVLEQLGYQAESGPWRNFYLMGARELRIGIPTPEAASSDPSMVSAMTLEMIFDAIAARLNGPQASRNPSRTLWVIVPEHGADPERMLAEVSNGAMTTTHVLSATPISGVQVSITLARRTLDALIAGELSLKDVLQTPGLVTIDGDPKVLIRFFAMIDEGDPEFPIVTPRPDPEGAWIGKAPKGADAAAATSLEEAVLERRFRMVGKLPRGC
ncbi:MAG TPA: alkyl sulfatase dimerization domain-containing protein [Polyangiaceae bacterium]|nr:alkyl sulfatase dimerization domain-containing protein [Polyangiaceae bacterium]